MRKNKKILAGLLVALTLIVSLLPASTVRAEENDDEKTEKTYTVTFRAGNVGTFNTDINTEQYSAKVTENYVKFSVKKGEKLPFYDSDDALYAFLQTLTSSVVGDDGTTIDYIKTNYRLRPITDWADGAATKEISRNTEYVLDYVRLVNPVMYTISFIDAVSKEQVAAPIIAYGEAGENIECKFGSIANYAPTTGNGSIVLDETNPDNNAYVFECVFTGDTGVVYVPGETIVNTVINEIPGAATPGVTVITPEGGGEEIPEENTPLAPGENGENVEIPEENTPLAPGEATEIGEDEVPLASGGEGSIQWPLIVVIIVVVLAIAGTVAVVVYRKKKIKKA